ncbi:MAG: flotillin-like protein FloA [Planctomycetia bacterium]|nr:flotillin-like protein FloA [Planctomycetia bacterium]
MTPLAADVTFSQIVLILGGVVLLVFLFVLLKFVKLWIQAYFSKADVSIFSLVGMWLRKVNAGVIVNSKIMAVQAGLKVDTTSLEALYLAGGHVPSVIKAMVAADRAGIPLDFKTAAGIDLAGRNVLEAIQTSVNPKVIDCPDPSKGVDTIDAVARNGIQIKVRARVTVRTNIRQLVGGATDETIIARVGEGIVATIGSATDHKEVLATPDRISKSVLAKGLDAGTAYEILSIDIADVNVGDNIGARLQADQAEADKRVAQAKAEERRSLAVAREQEMQAEVVENRAKVVLAEAEIPMAIANALKSGNMGALDYFNLKNLQADTDMRRSLGGGERADGGKAT